MPQDSVTQGQEAVTGSPRHQTVLLSQYGKARLSLPNSTCGKHAGATYQN